MPDVDTFFGEAEQAFRASTRLVALTGKYRVLPDRSTAADRFVFTMLGLQFLLQNNVLRIVAAGGEFQMITAAAFRAVGGFNERPAAAEDMDLFRRLSRIGRTRFAGNLTVYHSGRRALDRLAPAAVAMVQQFCVGVPVQPIGQPGMERNPLMTRRRGGHHRGGRT